MVPLPVDFLGHGQTQHAAVERQFFFDIVVEKSDRSHAFDLERPRQQHAADIVFLRLPIHMPVAAANIDALVHRGLKPNAWEPDVRIALEAIESLAALGGDAARLARAAAASPLAPAVFRLTVERAAAEKIACPEP